MEKNLSCNLIWVALIAGWAELGVKDPSGKINSSRDKTAAAVSEQGREKGGEDLAPKAQVALLDVPFCSPNDTFPTGNTSVITQVASGSGPPKPITSAPKTRKHPLVFHVLFGQH